MALRNLRGLACCSNSLRNYTTSSVPGVNLTVDDKTGIATITMQNPPVNILTLELLNGLVNTFQELEKNKSRGAILISGLNTVFSAGLDITQVHKPKPDRFQPFWSTLQETWLSLYGSSYPTVAVINGHAPAGGCMLALACEYRIMTNNFTIGLNESHLGSRAPKWLMASMQYAIGTRQTELALTTGYLFKTDEAFKIGMVDEVVQNKEEGIERAHQFLTRFTKIPPLARAGNKQSLRGKDIQNLVNTRQSEVDQLLVDFNSAEVTEAVESYWDSLKMKQR